MPPAVVAQGAPARWSIGHLTTDIVRITQLAREYYYRHQSAQEALTQVRALLAEIAARQHTMVESACRSMMVHYQSVLTYANYLEEQVARHAVDPSVRYDFDEVSESGFNLTLIARALSLYASNDSPIPMQVNLAQLMQQTMLSLSTSLDRRSMKLTTAEVDLEVAAHCEPITLTHVLWMLLLGTIRYAADESTLSLRCLYSPDRRQAQLSIVVSELCPGRLSEEERQAHFARQLQHLTPHLFAETIRIHANLQLAELLLGRLQAQLAVVPLTSYSCEICLTLPTD